MDNNFNAYVYVAGPLHSSGRPTANIRQALDVAKQIYERGAMPFVPHLYAYWDVINPQEAEYWLQLDQAWLQKCHAVFRIPGTSRGADLEEKWAGKFRLPVLYNMDEFECWLKDFDPQKKDEYSLGEMQDMIKPWVEKNFPHKYPPGTPPYRPFLGMVEELGEMAHAILKADQGIRGTAEEHAAAERDAAADLLIYMMDYANQRGIRLGHEVKDTWENTVSKRDWTKNKLDGSVSDASLVESDAPKIPQPKVGDRCTLKETKYRTQVEVVVREVHRTNIHVESVDSARLYVVSPKELVVIEK